MFHVEHLTHYRVWVDTSATVFSPTERQRIADLAFEQAKKLAHLAKIEVEPLLPVGSTWPFELTALDREILKLLKISPA